MFTTAVINSNTLVHYVSENTDGQTVTVCEKRPSPWPRVFFATDKPATCKRCNKIAA